jgi:ABC-type ATPase with predicted acetyltransferase domain
MWIKDTDDEFIEGIFDTEEGFEELRQSKKDTLMANAVVSAVLSGQPVNIEAIKLDVDSRLARLKRDDYKMTKDELKNLKYRLDLDITGESIDIPKKVETLTTLYQSQLQMQDMEGAKVTLKRILSLTGEKMPFVPTAQVNPAAVPTMPNMPQVPSNQEQQI